MIPPSGEKLLYSDFRVQLIIYICIVSEDSYSTMKASLILPQPHSVADVKMKNLHVCIFLFFSGVVSTNV